LRADEPCTCVLFTRRLGRPIRPSRRRTSANHNVERNILAIVTVDAPGGVEVMLQPEPGVSVTELEAVEFLLDAEKC
jgi:hypothetical protein